MNDALRVMLKEITDERDKLKAENERYKAVVGVVRSPVLSFAIRMERRMAAHDDDRGADWMYEDLFWLFDRLRKESKELKRELQWDVTAVLAEKIANEAADVANFAMMIAHNALDALDKTDGEEK